MLLPALLSAAYGRYITPPTRFDVGGEDKLYYFAGSRTASENCSLELGLNERFQLLKFDQFSSCHKSDFVNINLQEQELSFTIAIEGVGCGCVASVYMVQMPAQRPGDSQDYYCDGFGPGCGEDKPYDCCYEIDLFEMNMHAFHTTIHNCFSNEDCDHTPDVALYMLSDSTTAMVPTALSSILLNRLT
jgi:hypothetical protein